MLNIYTLLIWDFRGMSGLVRFAGEANRECHSSRLRFNNLRAAHSGGPRKTCTQRLQPSCSRILLKLQIPFL